ncbi:MAG: arginine--tRNA ligase [Alphaproteobacteria bacterium]|nr:arginine--tRNA ligase [Alphaproteobacteria bacterium]
MAASLQAELSALLGAAFAAEGLDAAYGRATTSDRPDLADFQCNGALAAAKAAGRRPRDLADAVAARVKDSALLAAVEVAGPGFLNLRLSDAALDRALGAMAAERGLGVPLASPRERIVVDFGGPNVAKPMHVGHLRSTIIGDSLQRLFRRLGHEVVSDVHLGDWGLQMGLVITEIAREKPGLPYFAAGANAPFPAASPVTIEELEELYPRASAAAKADAARNAEAQKATAELQAGRPGYRALWRHLVEVSRAAMTREFGRLDVHFDLWKGESDADPLIGEMIAAMRAKGIAEESEGALIVRVAQDGDKTELPPVILTSSQGTALYHTTDLATILDRVRSFSPDLILYVVDQRQHVHFEQVFRAARLAGLLDGTRAEHIGFGTVNGPDGKPFRTRAGGTMKLQDLIDMARAAAAERLEEAGLARDMPPGERDATAEAVGIAAVKFADLSAYRTSNYVFDLDRFIRFEGKTGPYLQYAAVRISSVLRKAAEEGRLVEGKVAIASPADRALALSLAAYGEALMSAAEKRAPNILCDYAFGLAQAFSRFYTEHHIVGEPDEALRASRLALARITRAVLEDALACLGIAVPERM